MTDDIKKMNPYKIDIGAVFTGKPKDHKKIKASEFKPLERELVFDIDMTDYDEIRTCCRWALLLFYWHQGHAASAPVVVHLGNDKFC